MQRNCMEAIGYIDEIYQNANIQKSLCICPTNEDIAYMTQLLDAHYFKPVRLSSSNHALDYHEIGLILTSELCDDVFASNIDINVIIVWDLDSMKKFFSHNKYVSGNAFIIKV